MKIKKIILGASIFMSALSANATCMIGTGVLNFGQYNPFQESDTYASVHINVNCDVDRSVVIKTQSILNYNQLRTMKNIQYPEVNDVLAYQVFINTNRDIFFGDGNNNTQVFSGTNKEFVLYGKLLKKQNVYKGLYQDNLILEINY